MRLPWSELSRNEYVRLCYEIAPLIGFSRRVYIESGPHSPAGYDIVAYRDNDILPEMGYPEKWLLAAIPYQPSPLRVEDVEFIKRWADEPLHEIDYILLITPAKISPELYDWMLKFNRFPIKKYKIKAISRVEIEQLISKNDKILGSFFGEFQPQPPSEEEETELIECLTKGILNFRSDLGMVDIYLHLLRTLEKEKQQEIINKLAGVWSFEGFERLKRWNAGWVLIRASKFAPEILPLEIIEKVAISGESIYKAQAAHIYAWLSSTKPDFVDPKVLARLLEAENDYFIHVPVTKAVVRLVEVNENTLPYIVGLLRDKDPITRLSGARIVAALAEENPMLVAPSIVEAMKNDDNEKIRKIAKEISEKTLSFWEAPLRGKFNKARELFESKEYFKAAAIFSELAKKADFSLRFESAWWCGYCYYLQQDYRLAARYFHMLLENDETKAVGHWWLSLVSEKSGNHEAASKHLFEITKIIYDNPELKIRISPEKEMRLSEAQPLIFKRLKEIKEF
jgi:tetratricopeptide (TPR) repeat protein